MLPSLLMLLLILPPLLSSLSFPLITINIGKEKNIDIAALSHTVAYERKNVLGLVSFRAATLAMIKSIMNNRISASVPAFLREIVTNGNP